MKRATWFIPVLFGVLACAAAVPTSAEDRNSVDDMGIPAYSVARIMVSDGSAWVRTAGGEDWQEYSSNSPLPPRSRVSIPEGSEAEL